MKLGPTFAAFLTLIATGRAADSPPAVRFGRDILPILSHNCFQCHGPDEKARKAKLRLDRRDSALAVLAPGKSAESELVRRIHAAPDQGLMPPAKTNRQLTRRKKNCSPVDRRGRGLGQALGL